MGAREMPLSGEPPRAAGLSVRTVINDSWNRCASCGPGRDGQRGADRRERGRDRGAEPGANAELLDAARRSSGSIGSLEGTGAMAMVLADQDGVLIQRSATGGPCLTGGTFIRVVGGSGPRTGSAPTGSALLCIPARRSSCMRLSIRRRDQGLDSCAGALIRDPLDGRPSASSICRAAPASSGPTIPARWSPRRPRDREGARRGAGGRADPAARGVHRPAPALQADRWADDPDRRGRTPFIAPTFPARSPSASCLTVAKADARRAGQSGLSRRPDPRLAPRCAAVI